MRFPAKKRWHSLPPSGCLGTSLPLPQSLCGRTDVRTDGRTDGRSRDYYVRTKISWIDSLPNFLSNGAPLAGFARRLRCSAVSQSHTRQRVFKSHDTCALVETSLNEPGVTERPLKKAATERRKVFIILTDSLDNLWKKRSDSKTITLLLYIYIFILNNYSTRVRRISNGR